MRVKAAVATAPHQPLTIDEVQLEQLRPDEVRVRIAGAGVCHSAVLARDQHYPVPLPAVLGDEGSGIVEAVGSAVHSSSVGDHVVLGFNSCGQCAQCRVGHPSSCQEFFRYNFGGYRPDGTTPIAVDGKPAAGRFFGQSSFAAHVHVPERIAVKVAPEAPIELLGPLGCGIMTGAGATLNVLRPQPGDSFAVFGTGAVGFAGLLAAKASGCSPIIAIDVSASRLNLARELGATHLINSADTDPVEKIRSITHGAGVDAAFDAVGISDVFVQMTESLASRGHGALAGAPQPGDRASIDVGRLLFTGQRLSMVIEGDAVPHEFVPRLVRLYQDGLFPFDRLIKTYPLDQINDALADATSGATVKPVVTFT